MPQADSLRYAGEAHLRNIRQLTFGGNNAEAYFSFDGEELVFQSDSPDLGADGCDQIFRMRVDGRPYADGSRYKMVSSGLGRTTCSYFLPDGRIIYASTHAASPECPAPPEVAEGRYVWPIYATYDVYVTGNDGYGPELLIGGDGYDAEATVSPDGRYVVFTSTRSGDLELWRYDLETAELLQLTDALGYDGGAFFSPDSRRIVWRASRPEADGAEAYRSLLAEGLVEPSRLNLFVANADGSGQRQVTNLDGANWAPFFHPDGEHLLFSSNHHAADGRTFAIFMVDLQSGELEQITHSGIFDAFPMFSFDGTRLVFSSNRNVDRAPSRETNVFVADWIADPGEVDLDFSGPVR